MNRDQIAKTWADVSRAAQEALADVRAEMHHAVSALEMPAGADAYRDSVLATIVDDRRAWPSRRELSAMREAALAEARA